MTDHDQGIERLSTYERRAWEQSLRRLHEAPSSASMTKARQIVSRGTSSISQFTDGHVPVETIKAIASKTMNGAVDLTFKPALKSASLEGTLRGYQKKHGDAFSVEDLRKLDLEHLDRFRRRKGGYVATSAMQGAAASLSITGTEVASMVTLGTSAGAIVGAVAADAVASLALMGRTVGSVAVRYGYDVRLPEEELFAMSVMSLGMATTLEAKHTALAGLSRLTQEMARQATWRKLNKHVLVKVTNRFYQSLGLRLTKRKLAQIVPVLGVGISAALSANITRTAYDRAEDVYRLRFLSDKYGIDPAEWMADTSRVDEQSPEQLEIPDVIQLLKDERRSDEERSLDEDENSKD